MFRWHSVILVSIKICLLGLFIAFASPQKADAAPCGGNGQKACAVWKPGPICKAGLGKVNGNRCAPCGKLNQKACPAAERGKTCNSGLVRKSGYCRAKVKAVDKCSARGQKPCHPALPGPICDAGLGNLGGTCQPCGQANQRSCPALERGKQCADGLVKSDDYCRPCGGNGEQKCPVTMSGPVCDSGLGGFDGVCRPCGQAGQRACPALERGRQCASGLDKHEGYCIACGGAGERACPVLMKGRVCDEGLGKFDGTCQPCGRAGEQACPRLERGNNCETGTRFIDGNCVPCGGLGERVCPAPQKGSMCEHKLIPSKLYFGYCEWDKSYAINPLVIYNRDDSPIFYSVGVGSGDAIPLMVASGSIAANSEVTTDLAGHDCAPRTVSNINSSILQDAIEGVKDSCAGRTLGIYFWENEDKYKTFRRTEAFVSLYSELLAQYSDTADYGSADLIEAWVRNVWVESQSIDSTMSSQGVKSVAMAKSSDRWVTFWGDTFPVGVGLKSGEQPNPVHIKDRYGDLSVSTVDAEGNVHDFVFAPIHPIGEVD